MSDKIAVRCPSAIDWGRVIGKAGFTPKERVDYYGLLDKTGGVGLLYNVTRRNWNRDNGYYEKKGYTIITAEEFLTDSYLNTLDEEREVTNMNTLNSSIRTVFVDENDASFALVEKLQSKFGGQIDQDFTGVLNLRNNQKAYVADIENDDKKVADAEAAQEAVDAEAKKSVATAKAAKA